MRISEKQIKELQKLLQEQAGVILSLEEAQSAGLAIVRFVSATEHRKYQSVIKESKRYEIKEN